jgi:cytochrome b
VTVGDPEKLAALQPGSKEHVDEAAYAEMRAFRKPIVTTHETVFYILLGAVAVHILGTVVAEVRDKNGLVSAMFSGQKVFRQPPAD